MKALISLLLFLLMLPLAIATPILSNPHPENGTYITGGAEYLFSIEVDSSNLNTNAVFLAIGSQEVWPEKASKFQMSCTALATGKWICNTSVVIAVAESGTKEFYLFQASDNDNTVGYYGNETNPLQVIIDRDPPKVFALFENNTYVSINKPLQFIINDMLSGTAEVQLWMYGNETWNSTWTELKRIDNSTFEADWDTSELPNNSTWFIYVNASDKVGNWKVENVSVVIVDNEVPFLEVLKPKEGDTLLGESEISVIAIDRYSGISYPLAILEPSMLTSTLTCNDTHYAACKGIIDVTSIERGNFTLRVVVYDNANNTAEKTIPVYVSNLYPIVKVVEPLNNSWVHGTLHFVVNVSNTESVKQAEIDTMHGSSVKGFIPMNCLGTTCSAVWDTSLEPEGVWDIWISIVNEFGYKSVVWMQIYLDNTPPILTPFPSEKLSGEASIGLTATDENGLQPNKTTVVIQELNYSEKMDCNVFVGGKKIVCSSKLDTTKIPNGKYTAQFFVYDLADNEAKAVEELNVWNEAAKSERTETEKTVAETPSSTSISRESILLFWAILAAISGIVAVVALYLTRKTQPPSKKVEIEKIEAEWDIVQAIKSYIYSALSTESAKKMKEYAKNINILIENLKEISPFKEILREMSKHGGREAQIAQRFLQKLEGKDRGELIEAIKANVVKVLTSENVEEMKRCFEEMKNTFEKLEEIIEEEKAIWNEFVEEMERENK